MKNKKFNNHKITPENPKWDNCIKRYDHLYDRTDDIRSEFNRDYNRILHSQLYRRLRHKTQVFFATKNDHICTRMEHVNHVASVSYTIANNLGFNTELTNAIAIGHDLGHPPFGHEGESILNKLSLDYAGQKFWHEGNGIYVCDNIGTLPSPEGFQQNLNLTYGVRDGIVSHCGEIDENHIKPRNEYIELYGMDRPSQYQPYTWEACVVKISDKISFLGRDIEDAIELRLLDKKQLLKLRTLIHDFANIHTLNNTILMHNLITDLCSNSSPEKGLVLSEDHLKLMNAVKEFNHENIYNHPRLLYYKKYSSLIINTLFETLGNMYDQNNLDSILKNITNIFPELARSFHSWLIKFSNLDLKEHKRKKLKNKIIYDIRSKKDYNKSIIDFIAGMTDNYAIKMYHEIISF